MFDIVIQPNSSYHMYNYLVQTKKEIFYLYIKLKWNQLTHVPPFRQGDVQIARIMLNNSKLSIEEKHLRISQIAPVHCEVQEQVSGA